MASRVKFLLKAFFVSTVGVLVMQTFAALIPVQSIHINADGLFRQRRAQGAFTHRHIAANMNINFSQSIK